MEKISWFTPRKRLGRKWQFCNIRISQPETKLGVNLAGSVGLPVIFNTYVLVCTWTLVWSGQSVFLPAQRIVHSLWLLWCGPVCSSWTGAQGLSSYKDTVITTLVSPFPWKSCDLPQESRPLQPGRKRPRFIFLLCHHSSGSFCLNVNTCLPGLVYLIWNY